MSPQPTDRTTQGMSPQPADRTTQALSRHPADRPMRALVAQPDVPLEVRAAPLASPGRELAVSHATAARLYGLPEPLVGWPRPEFTASSGPTRKRSGIWIRVAALDDDQVGEHLGISLTSPGRTVADCLSTLPGRDGLAIADAALRRGPVSPEVMLETLGRQARWPGVGLARQILALAEPRRESPLESWSAWAFAHTGVPAPQWQVEVRDLEGRLVGRVDCWWPAGLAGEADGRAKYALAAAERAGDSQAENLFAVLQAERIREQRLRESGADVVRWSAADVIRIEAARQLARRLQGALALAEQGLRFSGHAAPALLPLTTAAR